MKQIILFLSFLIPVGLCAQSMNISAKYAPITSQILSEALKDSSLYDNLELFLDTFGHRLSGSSSLEASLDWIVEQLKKERFDQVYEQKVLVPKWVRGNEYVQLTFPSRMNFPMLGLGGSIGTPPEGIEAEVLVVHDFEELQIRKDEAKGKIVVFNLPFSTYGETVRIRTQGAIEAAKVGAVASLIRSVASFSMLTPHTGTMRYDKDFPKIPHAAISVEHAELLQRIQERGQTPKIKLYMEAKTYPDVFSRNVIAEIKGSKYPEEVVVLGGHIDSWDVGQGAMDDAGGCFAAWKALSIIKKLGLRPKRTVRVVFWTNEENGLRGAQAYRDSVGSNVDNHVLAIESDAGTFKPTGFGFGGGDSGFTLIQEIAQLLQPINAHSITRPGGGADISPLMREGVPGLGLKVEGEKYFWYHHTEADVIDILDPKDLNECAAAMAVVSFVVADMDERFPRD